MDTFETIMAIVASLEGVGLITLFLFFKSRKKTENAKADTASEEAKHAALDNDSLNFGNLQKVYDWQSKTIESLQRQHNEGMSEIIELKKRVIGLEQDNIELKAIKCVKTECPDRKPPIDRIVILSRNIASEESKPVPQP